MRSRHRWVAAALIGGLGVAGAIVTAQEPPPDDLAARPTRSIEPRADEIFRAMSDYLASAKEFSFHAEVTRDEVVLDGIKVEYGASGDIGVRRPDRLYAEAAGDRTSRRFWYDGEHMVVYAEEANVYGKEPVPPTIDEALDHAIENLNFSPPLADLAYRDPYAVMTENVRLGFYVGVAMIDGTRCHHLIFLQDDIHWQIWIEDGKSLVPRKLVITYVDTPSEPRYSAVLSDWDFATRLPDRLFVPDPPDDAEMIEFLPMSPGPVGRDG